MNAPFTPATTPVRIPHVPQVTEYPYLTAEVEQIDALINELTKLRRWMVGAQRAKVNMEALKDGPRDEWSRLWCFNAREVENGRCEVLRAIYDLTEIDAVHEAYLEQSREAGLI